MLTKEQAEKILQAAKEYSDKGDMAGAIMSIGTHFEEYKVGFGIMDLVILSNAKDTAGLQKQLEGYAFWPS